ncbi:MULTISPECIES: hypothetical protein [Chryseobacterium]|uniref:Uncharacterized protein n=1 Tax=Chryseobacterium camelliae TaxID=1265445 RepID=A0ABU0TI20_9FLAO|nr:MULTISPECIES: hypothetical protein [Chryseobacterium]MDT3409430.1 hypothetical protein [Pseudacidovorax intermedius]MDQ1096705.1 hypothetical protein [Chryseobacterium camelliae]MDQ1100649.1 hypothetical protein [Chryseobacterium sp. SORGH_AS_1048]MDR6087987.1 hypothetical protein [Chryseobacterium sp. SORGH_AS_0909]MDR6132362.1 hypothetical protein [Chryseobacterium sp. SORGH_AS_1175]
MGIIQSRGCKVGASLFLLAMSVINHSCTKDGEDFFAENVPENIKNQSEYSGLLNYSTDLGTLNINTIANGNYPGENNPGYIKNISSPNFGYCHPDVQYFPNGFHG